MGVIKIIESLLMSSVDKIAIITSSRAKDLYSNIKSNRLKSYCVSDARDYRKIKLTGAKIRGFDLVIDTMSTINSGSIYFIGSAKARYNLFNYSTSLKASSHSTPIFLINSWATSPPSVWWPKFMHYYGFPLTSQGFSFYLPPYIQNKELNELIRKLGNYVVLNLDGGAIERKINYNLALKLITELLESIKLDIIIPYAPNERSKALRLSELFNRVHILKNQTSILETATLIKYSELLISPDTSAIHIASAFNVPTVGIYNKIDPRWLPQAEPSIVINVTQLTVNELNPTFLAKQAKSIIPQSFAT